MENMILNFKYPKGEKQVFPTHHYVQNWKFNEAYKDEPLLAVPIQKESEDELWQELHHNYLLYKLEGLQKMLKGEALFAYVQEKLSKEFTIKRK